MLRWNVLVVVMSVLSLADAASAEECKGKVDEGKTLFETKCVLCHNADNKDKKIGPGLQGIKDGKLPSGKDATYANLLDNLNKGGGGMPAFEKLITDEEKCNVITYAMTL